MIRHILLLNLKPETSDADREALFGQVRKLSDISSVQRLTIGEVLQPRDAAYRARMSSDFRYVLLVEFADEEGLEIYQKDPFHVEVGQEIRKHASGIMVTDFVTPE